MCYAGECHCNGTADYFYIGETCAVANGCLVKNESWTGDFDQSMDRDDCPVQSTCIDEGLTHTCQCDLGMTGDNCDVSVCDGFCSDLCSCNVDDNGYPQCVDCSTTTSTTTTTTTTV